jgi:NAD-dependent DNA ligase
VLAGNNAGSKKQKATALTIPLIDLATLQSMISG